MSGLNSKNIKTLTTLRDKTDVSWNRVQALFKHLGIAVENHNGSRVTARFNEAVMHMHTPHGSASSHHLTHQNVRTVRAFLRECRIL